jgi:hypothetical protein
VRCCEGCQFYARQTHLQRKRCRQYPSRGPSQSRTSTWWVHSYKHPGASPTFS